MDLKEMLMDRNGNIGGFLLSRLGIVMLCFMLCVLSGCEEVLSPDPEVSAAPELVETESAAMEIEETAKVAPGEVLFEGPVEAEAVEENVAEVMETEVMETEVVAETPDEAVVMEDEAAVEPEETEIAVVIEDVELKDPVPVKSVEMIEPETDDAVNVDNMYTAAVSYLADNGQGPLAVSDQAGGDVVLEAGPVALPVDVGTAAAEVESDAAADAPESERSVKNFFPRVGGAIMGFAREHFIIVGGAIIFVAIIVMRRKKIFPLSFLRRKRHA
jgi:hypothetical protein